MTSRSQSEEPAEPVEEPATFGPLNPEIWDVEGTLRTKYKLELPSGIEGLAGKV
jgi:hypothetical protein